MGCSIQEAKLNEFHSSNVNHRITNFKIDIDTSGGKRVQHKVKSRKSTLSFKDKNSGELNFHQKDNSTVVNT